MVAILALNFVFSIWNAYASGFNMAVLRKNPNGPLWMTTMIMSVAGLVLAFVGMTYTVAIVGGLAAAYLGYIDVASLTVLLAYNFLVFGGLITVFGIVVTIEGIVVAYKTRNKWSILISVWNVAASVWNCWTYLSNFKTLTGIVKSKTSGQVKIFIIISVATVIAFIVVYAAYHMGHKRGERQ